MSKRSEHREDKGHYLALWNARLAKPGPALTNPFQERLEASKKEAVVENPRAEPSPPSEAKPKA